MSTSNILMIRPVNFAFNAETAVNNAFQVAGKSEEAQEKASKEFDAFVSLLRTNGVDVTVVDDSPQPYTPDSIFPNNWISFHENGAICLYPMYAANRRLERKQKVLDAIAAKFKITETIDFTAYEKESLFLEGTGSMVLDHVHKIAYACLSPRTDKKVLDDFCKRMHYTAVVFHAVDDKGVAIYHTNVMMCVADCYIVICLDAIPDAMEKQQVITVMNNSGKDIVDISLAQMNQFAGNMLQVTTSRAENLLVMSERAYHSLSYAQVTRLSSFNRLVHSPLDAIETNGGGSARCMMAEVLLPKK